MGRKSRPVLISETALFSNLAEQVRMPFMQIAHAAELAAIQDDKEELRKLFSTVGVSSQAALMLIDGYLLSLRMQQEQKLELEPVSMGSVLYDAAHQIDNYAKTHNCEVQITVLGKNQPVMAQRNAVESAFINLGYSFIDAVAAMNGVTRITLGAKKVPGGVSAGVFSDSNELTSLLLKQAKAISGTAKQPLALFSAGSGAGIFVADSLFSLIGRPLRVTKMQSQKGLATTLDPSSQLALV